MAFILGLFMVVSGDETYASGKVVRDRITMMISSPKTFKVYGEDSWERCDAIGRWRLEAFQK